MTPEDIKARFQTLRRLLTELESEIYEDVAPDDPIPPMADAPWNNCPPELAPPLGSKPDFIIGWRVATGWGGGDMPVTDTEKGYASYARGYEAGKSAWLAAPESVRSALRNANAEIYALACKTKTKRKTK